MILDVSLGIYQHTVNTRQIQALRSKICGHRLTCKVATKCLNVGEWEEMVEWNRRCSPPFPCCPVSRQCP